MLQESNLTLFMGLPELQLTDFVRGRKGQERCFARKKSSFEICPKCATPSRTIYDRRKVKVHDAPVRGSDMWLEIIKRRFYCKMCKKPFTEPVRGIRKGKRTTERFRRSLLWACENFGDLKKVKKAYRCSNWLVYQTLYEHLKINLKRHINYSWPKTIGIDEHFFSRQNGFREFATVVVDFNHKRVFELARGKNIFDLENQLRQIPGRENVKQVALDLSDTYKSFVKQFFPNAKMIADKFHVLRLLNPAINRYRKEITGDRRTHPIRKLLLRSGKKLEYFERRALREWLEQYPNLKEAMYSLYRINRAKDARKALTRLTDRMALSKIKEIKTLRKTLVKWREEVLNYFENRITNARTEGFNNVAKLIQKRAFGVKSFELYRLRYLNACV